MTSVSEDLRQAFGRGDAENLAWQLDHPVVGARERDLVRAAFEPLGERVLDVGMGEGATLFHLGDVDGCFGIELFPDKLRVARSRLRRARLTAASAYALPFADGAFDHVLVRDVIHHLDRPEEMLRECRRVLSPGGRVDVLEPCRYNPLIVVHALSQRVERGELRSTVGFLTQLLQEAGLSVREQRRHQAMPLHRLLFHRKFGLPDLGSSEVAKATVTAIEKLAERVVPRFAWAYIHVRAVRP